MVALDSEVAQWLHDAVAVADSWDSVLGELRTHDPKEKNEDARLRPFIVAFAFVLHERFSTTRGRDGVFGSAMAGEDWRFPPALADIEDDDVQAWREAFDAIEHHVVRARLGDLLWERKVKPRPDLWAQGAYDGLLKVAADTSWHAIDRACCLSRALELAREIHDKSRQQIAVDRMVGLVEMDLQTQSGGPGVSLGALQPLVELPPDERPDDLDELLVRVDRRYDQDPFIGDSIAELRSTIAAIEQRKQLRLEQIRRWRETAAQDDTMLRVHRLGHALEIARTHGLRSQAEELRRELGNVRPDDVGLERISAAMEIPADEIDRFRAVFGEAPSWQDALRILAVQGPPGGAPDELAEQVDKVMGDSAIQYLFTKIIIGPDNASPIFRAASPTAHRQLAMAEHRAWAARVWSVFCVESLDCIALRADRPDHDALTEFFTSAFIEPEIAERVARAVELFWDAQPDESAHVLVPRLERVLREIARQIGMAVVREPSPRREIGGVETLGALLSKLEGAFLHPGWHAYLDNLLVNPLGLNLRNSIAHGPHGTISRLDAALLVQAALLLTGMSLQPVAKPPEPPPAAAPAT